MPQPIRSTHSTVTRSQARLYFESERVDMSPARVDQALVDIFGDKDALNVYSLLALAADYHYYKREAAQGQHSRDEAERRF
jgi:hypothetical protein